MRPPDQVTLNIRGNDIGSQGSNSWAQSLILSSIFNKKLAMCKENVLKQLI